MIYGHVSELYVRRMLRYDGKPGVGFRSSESRKNREYLGNTSLANMFFVDWYIIFLLSYLRASRVIIAQENVRKKLLRVFQHTVTYAQSKAQKHGRWL